METLLGLFGYTILVLTIGLILGYSACLRHDKW